RSWPGRKNYTKSISRKSSQTLSRKGYSTSELSELMSIYQQEFRTARDLLGKPIPLPETAV
ncbi:hypothetical protein, partial [Ectopseudomonas oleovorans]|uniref:hypothetical protein n=1 Tax=Ectopseudomonas oleovorans TaxID=301 RepID=UPI001A8FCFC5